MIEEQRKEFLAKLEECQENDDTEAAHIYADKLLCEVLITLGYKDIVEAWDDVSKWYS